MNRKSRMKSTLDSLFSSNKTQSEPQTSSTPVEKAVDKPVVKEPVRAPAEKKLPEKKTAAKAKPAPVKPPVKAASAEIKAPKVEEKPTASVPAPAPVKPADPAPVKAPEKPVEPTPAPRPVMDTRPVAAAAQQSAAPEPSSQAVSANGNGGHEVADTDEEVHLVVFMLANEAFGIGIHMVESIIKKQAITKVPHAEKFILGVTNLRGTVVPVVDLRERFSLPSTEATKDTRIIVLNSDGGKDGIVVDEVMEVLRIPKSSISPTPPITTTVNSSFIKGIARTEERLIILLDVNTILTH